MNMDIHNCMLYTIINFLLWYFIGKKVMPYLLLGIFTTMSIVGGMALKMLAAIAGKALIASKVALTIAGIIALKKLFSHEAAPETTFQVHADGHHR